MAGSSPAMTEQGEQRSHEGLPHRSDRGFRSQRDLDGRRAEALLHTPGPQAGPNGRNPFCVEGLDGHEVGDRWTTMGHNNLPMTMSVVQGQ